MAVKINGVLRGQDANEQFKLEKKRFRMRKLTRENAQAIKRERLKAVDDGKNRHLI